MHNNDSIIFCFHEDEIAEYDLQIGVLKNELPGALDELSNYSCHSIPHIQEVMEQCDIVFTAMREWLIEQIGFSSNEISSARLYLLHAAKFHDIGMSGTQNMRKLLMLVDEMHRLYSLNSVVTLSMQQLLLSQIENYARQAENECSCWDGKPELYGTLCRSIIYADPRKTDYCVLLSRYHELIKNAIRKYHGEASARWILDHRHKLEKRYGSHLDWDMIAIIAALHTGSLLYHKDDKGTQRTCADYCKQLCTQFSLDSSFIEKKDCFLRIQALVSILRLADQRRSGSRLLTLEKYPITVGVTDSGFLRVEYLKDGIVHHPLVKYSNELILAEKLNEFGGVSVSRRSNNWVMKHELVFSLFDDDNSRRILVRRRIPSYVEEIYDSLISVSGIVTHLLEIRFAGYPFPENNDVILLSFHDIMKLKKENINQSLDTLPAKLRESIWQNYGVNIKISAG